MFINKDSVIVNGVSLGQYLLEVKYGFNKIWSNDSGRNLYGTMSGTLIGIFPKLTLKFRKLTKEELEIIAPILDSARQTTSYYDPTKQTQVTITTYTGDYEITNKKIINDDTKKVDSFNCSLISVRKRA